MDAGTRTNLKVVPLTKHIGAEIRGIDLRDTLDTATIRDIHRAWLDHLVLVFRGQRFSQEDLIRATGYFGEIGPLSADEIFPQRLREAPAQHHVDIKHQRERRNDRGAAGRRDALPSRHDPRRAAAHRHAVIFGGDPEPWRRYAVRQWLRGLRHPRSDGPAA